MILDAVGWYSNIFKQEGEQIKSMSHFFISPFFTIFFGHPLLRLWIESPPFRVLGFWLIFRRSAVPPIHRSTVPPFQHSTAPYVLISGRGNTEKVFYIV